MLGGIPSTAAIHVFTRSDACGAAETWAAYLGKKQEDLGGVGVYGDPGLADAVRRDPLGIGFNNVNFAYDPKTLEPVDGLAVVPIDLDGNGTIEPAEAVLRDAGRPDRGDRRERSIPRLRPATSTSSPRAGRPIGGRVRVPPLDPDRRASNSSPRPAIIPARAPEQLKEGLARDQIDAWPSDFCKDLFARRAMRLSAAVPGFVVLLMLSRPLREVPEHPRPQSFADLLFGSAWHPLKGEFGFYPFLIGTSLGDAGGHGHRRSRSRSLTAIYLSEYAPRPSGKSPSP